MSHPKMILDPRINFTARERVDRMGEWALRGIAHRLPYKIKYWAFIDFAVQHIADNEVVPEVRVTQILQRARN